MRYALASKTCIAITLLVARLAVDRESRRLQNDLGVLRRAGGRTAMLALVRGQSRRPAGLELVRHLLASQVHAVRQHWLG